MKAEFIMSIKHYGRYGGTYVMWSLDENSIIPATRFNEMMYEWYKWLVELYHTKYPFQG